MRLMELEQEVYDPAFLTHITHPQMSLRKTRELTKLLDLPEIDQDVLTGLILAESYIVAKGDDSQLAIVWKNWDEMSRPPFDVVEVVGVRMRIPWNYYGSAYNELASYLQIREEVISEQHGQGWPIQGWQRLLRGTSRFPDLKLLTIHDRYGCISPVVRHQGVVYLPLRSITVVTNSPTPFALVV